MKIEISKSAVQDLLAGFQFYEQREEAVGRYFLDSLFADIDSLVLYAGLHQIINGYHRMIAQAIPVCYLLQSGPASCQSVSSSRLQTQPNMGKAAIETIAAATKPSL